MLCRYQTRLSFQISRPGIQCSLSDGRKHGRDRAATKDPFFSVSRGIEILEP
jgi:hypothetical protein